MKDALLRDVLIEVICSGSEGITIEGIAKRLNSGHESQAMHAAVKKKISGLLARSTGLVVDIESDKSGNVCYKATEELLAVVLRTTVLKQTSGADFYYQLLLIIAEGRDIGVPRAEILNRMQELNKPKVKTVWFLQKIERLALTVQEYFPFESQENGAHERIMLTHFLGGVGTFKDFERESEGFSLLKNHFHVYDIFRARALLAYLRDVRLNIGGDNNNNITTNGGDVKMRDLASLGFDTKSGWWRRVIAILVSRRFIEVSQEGSERRYKLHDKFLPISFACGGLEGCEKQALTIAQPSKPSSKDDDLDTEKVGEETDLSEGIRYIEETLMESYLRFISESGTLGLPLPVIARVLGQHSYKMLNKIATLAITRYGTIPGWRQHGKMFCVDFVQNEEVRDRYRNERLGLHPFFAEAVPVERINALKALTEGDDNESEGSTDFRKRHSVWANTTLSNVEHIFNTYPNRGWILCTELMRKFKEITGHSPDRRNFNALLQKGKHPYYIRDLVINNKKFGVVVAMGASIIEEELVEYIKTSQFLLARQKRKIPGGVNLIGKSKQKSAPGESARKKRKKLKRAADTTVIAGSKRRERKSERASKVADKTARARQFSYYFWLYQFDNNLSEFLIGSCVSNMKKEAFLAIFELENNPLEPSDEDTQVQELVRSPRYNQTIHEIVTILGEFGLLKIQQQASKDILEAEVSFSPVVIFSGKQYCVKSNVEDLIFYWETYFQQKIDSNSVWKKYNESFSRLGIVKPSDILRICQLEHLKQHFTGKSSSETLLATPSISEVETETPRKYRKRKPLWTPSIDIWLLGICFRASLETRSVPEDELEITHLDIKGSRSKRRVQRLRQLVYSPESTDYSNISLDSLVVSTARFFHLPADYKNLAGRTCPKWLLKTLHLPAIPHPPTLRVHLLIVRIMRLLINQAVNIPQDMPALVQGVLSAVSEEELASAFDYVVQKKLLPNTFNAAVRANFVRGHINSTFLQHFKESILLEPGNDDAKLAENFANIEEKRITVDFDTDIARYGYPAIFHIIEKSLTGEVVLSVKHPDSLTATSNTISISRNRGPARLRETLHTCPLLLDDRPESDEPLDDEESAHFILGKLSESGDEGVALMEFVQAIGKYKAEKTLSTLEKKEIVKSLDGFDDRMVLLAESHDAIERQLGEFSSIFPVRARVFDNLDGSTNKELKGSLSRRLLLKIHSNPGVKQERLIEEFDKYSPRDIKAEIDRLIIEELVFQLTSAREPKTLFSCHEKGLGKEEMYLFPALPSRWSLRY